MSPQTDVRQGVEGRPDIFVSYSRKDGKFVDRLAAALEERGFAPKIDRADIYAFEDWRRRLEELIVKADTIVFVVSPDAVASEHCQWELGFAAKLKKRLAPVVYRPVADNAIPSEVERLNFIFFDDDEKFDDRVDKLTEALAIDIEWVRKHTEFGAQALRWSKAGRPGPKGLLLRPPLLEDAEGWIASRPAGATSPTEETREFITESRKAETKRRDRLFVGLTSVLIGALALSGLATWQWGRAEKATIRATDAANEARAQRDQALIKESTLLAEKSRTLQNEQPIIAAQIALSGLPKEGERPWVAETFGALLEILGKPRPVQTFKGHEREITRVGFSGDGRLAVTASVDGTARIWEVATGKQTALLRVTWDTKLPTLTGDPDKDFGKKEISDLMRAVYDASFSSDGKRVVTASSGSVKLWDATTGALIQNFPLETGFGTVLSPDGSRLLSRTLDDAARLSDVSSGQEIFKLQGHKKILSSAEFSSDGKRIVTSSQDETARVWDATTGATITELRGHEDMVNFAAFSPDGKYVATASRDKTARLWDAQSGKVLAILRGHSEALISVAFSHDGRRLLTASHDATIRVWDMAMIERYYKQDGIIPSEPPSSPLSTTDALDILHHDWSVNYAAFNPDGTKILSAQGKNIAQVWEVGGEKRTSTFKVEKSIWATDISPEATRVLTSSYNHAHMSDAHLGNELYSVEGRFSAFSPDGALVLMESPIRSIWNTVTGRKSLDLSIKSFSDDVMPFFAAFSPDGARAITISTSSKSARLWSTATGRETAVLLGHEHAIGTAAFSPDGARVATSASSAPAFWASPNDRGDEVARVWDTTSGKEIATLVGHSAQVNSVAFSPDGERVVTASDDRTARIWNVAMGKDAIVLRGHSEKVVAAEFSPDGALIATVSEDKTARLWDSKSGREIAILLRAVAHMGSATFSPDGMRVLTASDTSARLWDVRKGSEIAVLHTSRPIYSAKFSRDGKHVCQVDAYGEIAELQARRLMFF